jgi:hypothetical protein
MMSYEHERREDMDTGFRRLISRENLILYLKVWTLMVSQAIAFHVLVWPAGPAAQKKGLSDLHYYSIRDHIV